MIYGYIRVSTNKQTVENQRYEIQRYAQNHNIHIDEWIQETISGTISPTKRNLGKLISNTQRGDTIICSELSRLGRSMFMIMSILNTLMENEVLVFTVKEGYKLGQDLQSKVLAFAFSISAEIERTLISERTTEALKRVKSEGTKLGRPLGRKNHALKLSDKKTQIIQMLADGMKKTYIAQYLNVSPSTLYSFMKTNNIIY